ncbi:MAG: hypothetical protein JST53_12005 [Actinobacteria bacterium]|nr:hypothetical protein [Actinomycetota bacterium]
MSFSPDGKSMLATIDSQTRHYLDWASLMPFRGFFDAPWVAGLAISHVSSAKLRSCAPFSSELLPSTGDQNGELVGQTLDPYDGGEIRDSGDINGWPTWSPNSTAVALSTQSFATLKGAPYLLVAHFPNRQPTAPMPVASSAPGSWAPTQVEYHGAIGATTEITLHGLASGTVTLRYNNPLGILSAEDTANYVNYSDDGRSFVNGTQTVSNVGGPIHIVNDLTLSGEHTGSLHGDITFNADKTYSGTQTATFDGTSATGPEQPEQLCREVKSKLPGREQLEVSAERIGETEDVRVGVESTRAGAGLDERGVDRRPVLGATVTVGGQTASTDEDGVAVLHAVGLAAAPGTVTAGDTFAPATFSLPAGAATNPQRCGAGEVGGYPSCVKPSLTILRAHLTRRGAVFRVRVNSPGKLRLIGGGLVDREGRLVSAGSRRLSSSLTKRARRKLRRTGTVKVAATVRFMPTGGTRISRHARLSTKVTRGG